MIYWNVFERQEHEIGGGGEYMRTKRSKLD